MSRRFYGAFRDLLDAIEEVPDESSKVPVEEVEVPDRKAKMLEESEGAGLKQESA